MDDTWTEWSAPENLGKGINGPGDDLYFYTPNSGSHSYFTKGSSDENTDIYRFRTDELFLEIDDTEPLVADIPDPITTTSESDGAVAPVIPDEPVVPDEPVKEVFVTIVGNVYDSRTNQPIVSDVLVERLPDGLRIGKTYSDADGFFSFKRYS